MANAYIVNFSALTKFDGKLSFTALTLYTVSQKNCGPELWR